MKCPALRTLRVLPLCSLLWNSLFWGLGLNFFGGELGCSFGRWAEVVKRSTSLACQQQLLQLRPSLLNSVIRQTRISHQVVFATKSNSNLRQHADTQRNKALCGIAMGAPDTPRIRASRLHPIHVSKPQSQQRLIT
jgi:hypothetical protein